MSKKLSTSLIMDFYWPFQKEFGFGNNFVDWIKMLVTVQESCVINGGNGTYFK